MPIFSRNGNKPRSYVTVFEMIFPPSIFSYTSQNIPTNVESPQNACSPSRRVPRLSLAVEVVYAAYSVCVCDVRVCVGGRHKRGLYRHMRPTRLSRLGGKADIAGGVSKPFRRPCREFSTAWFLVAVGRGRERDDHESLRSLRENRPSGRQRRFLTDSPCHTFARAGAPSVISRCFVFRSVRDIRERGAARY